MIIKYFGTYAHTITAIEDGLLSSNASATAIGSPLAGKLFVVLGAGGAGESLAYGAAQKGARFVVANHTFERAKELANKVGGQDVTLVEVEHFRLEEGMVLANTTSVGMKPKIDDTPLFMDALKNYCLALDMPNDTRLLREARDNDAVIMYGTEMLIRPGFEQYKNFTGLPASEDLFRQLMEKHA